MKYRLSTIKFLPIALACLATGTEAEAAARYLCKLIDGTVHVVEQDLTRRFPSAIKSCRLIEVEIDTNDDQKPASDSTDDAPASVRVIVAQDDMASPVAPHALQAIITTAANRHGVDARLVQAVIQVESAFNANARSPKGALGLMQLMPATAARFGAAADTDLFNPAVNVDLGVRYLRVLSEQFSDRVDLVLAAYNAGEGAVVRSGYAVPPFRETREYVRKILDLYPAGE